MKLTFVGALFLLLLALKLTGYIAWSWWWVFSPFWGVFLICLVLVLLFGRGKLY